MIEYSININSSCKQAFEISQNYNLRLQWDPFPESYKFINGDTVTTGLRVLVKAKNGQTMLVEYVSFNPPKAAAIKMIKGPWFISKFSGSWLFKETDNNHCRVTFKYSIKVRPALLRFIMAPILNFIFKRNVKHRLHALKLYIENKYDMMKKQSAD